MARGSVPELRVFSQSFKIFTIARQHRSMLRVQGQGWVKGGAALVGSLQRRTEASAAVQKQPQLEGPVLYEASSAALDTVLPTAPCASSVPAPGSVLQHHHRHPLPALLPLSWTPSCVHSSHLRNQRKQLLAKASNEHMRPIRGCNSLELLGDSPQRPNNDNWKQADSHLLMCLLSGGVVLLQASLRSGLGRMQPAATAGMDVQSNPVPERFSQLLW